MKESIEISELKIGMKFCLENASELINDAEILSEQKRYSRTHTLSQFALEEIGKAFMLYQLYNSIQSDKRKEFDFKTFRKNFRNHKAKTLETTMIDLMMYAENKTGDFKTIALENFRDIQKVKNGNYDKKKNDSLYVSIENNKFVKPSELFKEKETLDFLFKTKSKVEFLTNWIIKWLDMDEWLGADKEGILTELQNELKKE
jgi:AbiV family abortive infection protein